MGRSNNSNEKVDQLKKGPWTREEDQKLLAYIEEHGHGSWRALPAKAGLERCGKSCRLRWTNYLRPDIKRGKFSSQEEKDIIRLHALLGNRWSAIATHLPKRTDNEIKNYWNTRLKKRLTRMGIDPVTHKPKESAPGSAQTRQAAVVSHMAQWETARLEAEARLVRESKFLSKLQLIHKVNAPPPPPQPAAPPCLDVLKVWRATSTATQNGFFRSRPGSLESPTSTLNFSMINNNSSFAVPTTVGIHGSSVMDDGVMCMSSASGGCGGVRLNEYVEFEGKMDNSMELKNGGYDYNNVVVPPRGAMDMGSMDYDDDDDYYEEDKNNKINEESLISGYNYDVVIGDNLEDNRSYWNELLNLVTSPMVSHVF